MFKLIKELMNLRKSIEEKTKELNRLEKDINNRENIINNIKSKCTKWSKYKVRRNNKSRKTKTLPI